jgi:acyl-CoA synthetase (AMP-forming)/AMP-acid ligase II
LEGKPLLYHVFKEHAAGSNANNLFLIFEDRSWTYKQFFEDIQRVGNWLMNDLGVKPEEIVAIDGGNSPEYLLLWFGLESIRAIPAFINCNLTAGPLTHSVKLCDARYLLADKATQDLVAPCEDDLKAANVQTIYYDDQFISSLSDKTPIPASRQQGVRPDEVGGLIYTSGTTGMPKGVIMVRGRELTTAWGVATYLELKPGNRMYSALPLYHGAAHGLCMTPSIWAGSTVVLSRKFSHKTFWPEVRKSRADILQYVGELCRYLVNAPPSPDDKNHSVKVAWGNGMRPDVWEVFRTRFGIETINELYAATDGLGSSFNANRGEFGRNAIAVRGLLWRWVNGMNEKRVRMDTDTQEILRDSNGFAIECNTDEPGEVLHRIADPASAEQMFRGYYKNRDAGSKRFIRDVFAKDDMWFRSGDMMRQDPDGRVYFVDRLGDTFRWRSENVSTNEVSDVVGDFDQIAEANVYGVQVPHADGRAGCAAVVPVEGITADTLDLARLAEHAISTLPRYAVPIFVRVVPQLEYTGTMKMQKGRLRSEGIEVEKIQASSPEDRVFWLPPGAKKYVPYGPTEWEDVKAGRVKL